MRIGILSDSHGRAGTTALAVAALRRRGAELLIHLGDIETDEVIDELVGHNAHVVFGNMDWNVDALTRYARSVGIAVEHPMGCLTIDGKQVAFTHGDRESLMQDAVTQNIEYLLHGHTHAVRDERVASTRIINPGALFRADRYTVAVLDPGSDALEIVEIPKTST